MSSKWLLTSLVLLPIINTQRVVLWSSSFASTIESQWQTASTVEMTTDSNCPLRNNCCQVRRNSELYRYDSTVGYHSIEVQYSFQSEDVTISSSVDGCQFWTIYGKQSDINNDWTLVDASISTNSPTTKTFSLPVAAENEAIVGISFYTETNSIGWCRYNNIALTGILITKDPTRTPTSAPVPTISPTNNPSITPSNDPSNMPTTQIPSISPTRNPSLHPTTHTPTIIPTTSMPITMEPSSSIPTNIPSTYNPTTNAPSTLSPVPSTSAPITLPPTTFSPTSKEHGVTEAATDTTVTYTDSVGNIGDELSSTSSDLDTQSIIIVILSVIIGLFVVCILMIFCYKKLVNKTLKNETDMNMSTSVSMQPTSTDMETLGNDVGDDIVGVVNLKEGNQQNNNENKIFLNQSIIKQKQDNIDGVKSDSESDDLYKDNGNITNDNEEELYDIHQTNNIEGNFDIIKVNNIQTPLGDDASDDESDDVIDNGKTTTLGISVNATDTPDMVDDFLE